MTDPARISGGKAILKVNRNWPNASAALGTTYAFVDVVEPLDGDPILAVGAGPVWVKGSDGKELPVQCAVRATMGDYGIGYHARQRDFSLGSDGGSEDDLFGWAPWSNPTNFTTKTLARESWIASPNGVKQPGIYFPELTLGEHGFWLGARAPTTTAFLNVTTQAPKLTNENFFSEYPIAVSGGAIVFDVDAHAVARVKEDGSFVRLVTPAASKRVTWKVIDRSGADRLVWVESELGGLDYVNSTLWSAPLAASEAELVRTKIANLDDTLKRGGSGGVANRGVFVSLVSRTRALVTRLSDGMGWYVDAEPKQRLVAPVWIDDDDVLVEVAPDDPPGQFDEYPSGILRVARSTLGAPTVPSGL